MPQKTERHGARGQQREPLRAATQPARKNANAWACKRIEYLLRLALVPSVPTTCCCCYGEPGRGYKLLRLAGANARLAGWPAD